MAKLTELEIRNAKPGNGGKPRTISAGYGLTLLVMPDGARYWRLRYYFGGKRRMVTLGKPYPETSLKQAREKAAEFRAQLGEDREFDPVDQRRTEKLALHNKVANTFEQAAEAWHTFRSQAWNPKTAEQVRDYLDKDLLPKLKSRPLDSISPSELGAIVAGIEARGAHDIALKTRQWLNAIFSYARANGWTKNDPARDLKAIALPRPEVKHYAHIDAAELTTFLKALDGYDGSVMVKSCAMLSLWTANRPGVTRSLRWDELDLNAGLWKIPKGRAGMKRGYVHITPLPTQAVAMLRGLRRISGNFDYVFLGRNDPRKPISDGAFAQMMKKIGYHGKQTQHGFRHLISTELNNSDYKADHIERQLAHGDPDKIRGTYNEAHYIEQRREMLQAWANRLDALRDGRDETVIGQ
jgi:integrase